VDYLVDTNLLLRLVDSNAPQHAAAAKAVAILKNSDNRLFITPQNLIEFWAVATRPLSANGFGWTRIQTDAELGRLRGFFPLLADTAAVFDEWLKLV
jgi:predicted nucleic acid-binding protein